MPYEAIEQPILPYFRHRFTFKRIKDKVLLFLELFYFATIEIIPAWNFVGIRKSKQQRDASSPMHSWGTGQMFLKCTGTASELYWNRLDMFLEYSEQLFWILEKICLIEVI